MMAFETVFDDQLQANKDFVWWMYLFHGLCLVFSLGLLSCLPLIANYIKRDETRGTFVYSHHRWQIRSFWFYLLWLFVGGVLWITIIGMPVAVLIWTGAWIWKAYRIIKGWLDLSNNKAMPLPE
jgi:uncharacterized membrane protein